MKYGILITLLLLLNINSAFGQEPEEKVKSAEFYFNSGISIPMSQKHFAEYYNKSYNVGFGLGFDLSQSFLIIIEFAYNKFNLDGTDFINSHENLKGSASKGDEGIYSFTTGAKVKLSASNENIRPYLKLSFGFMHQRLDELYIEALDPDTSYVLPQTFNTSIMLHFGVGMEIQLKRGFYLFSEAKITYAFTEERHQYVPFKVGILYRK